MQTDNDGRVWYYRFKQDKDAPEKPYLTRYSQPTCILAKMVKGRDNDYYMFTSFDSWHHRQMYSDAHPELSLFEYMPEYVKERKIYFDIDHEVSKEEKDQWIVPHRTHLSHVITKLSQLFDMYKLPFTDEDIRVYQSCGEKGNMYKFSYHVVVVTYLCSSPEHVRHICKEVRDYVEAAFPMSVEARKESGEVTKSWIDRAPYNKSQQFRLYGSSKPGSNRKKTLLQEEGCAPNQYSYWFNGRVYHRTLPNYSEKSLTLGGCNPLHLESLITASPLCPRDNHILPITFCPVPRREVKEGVSVTLEQTDAALEAATVEWPYLEGQYETGSSDEENKLVRIAPGRCPQCEVVHENENAYINRCADGSMWFMCLRARKNLRISNFVQNEAFGVSGGSPNSEKMGGSDSESDDEEEYEDEPATIIPIDYKSRGLNNPCARVAYREGWGIADRAATKAIKSFSRILPQPIYPKKGPESDDEDAVLTAMEGAVYLAGCISQHYKLRDGRLTTFARLKEIKDDPTVDIVYYVPSTQKTVTVRINISTILQGDFIYDNTFPSVDASLESEERRRVAKEFHDEYLCIMPEEPCYIPYFRDSPAPLLDPRGIPRPKMMNVSTGFACNPIRYMWTFDGMGGQRRITVAEFEQHPLISPMVTLMKYGLCKGDKAEHNNLMNWTAHPVAHPEDSRTKKAIVSVGDEGTGKSVMGDIMKKIYGPLYVKPGENDVMGKFNKAIEGKLFVQLDEPEQREQSQRSNRMSSSSKIAKMKDRITCKFHSIRRMREDAFEVPALENYYISSNFCDIDFINSEDKRRYLVLQSRCVGYDVTLQRYVYSLNSTLTSGLEDETGNPLDITFDVKRGEAVKNYFYKNILGPAIDHVNFGDIFAAYLLAWANENDTYAIRDVIQNVNCEVRQKIRDTMRNPVAIFMDELRGTGYSPSTNIKFEHITRMKLNCEPSRNTYYVSFKDLHTEYKKWFETNYPQRMVFSAPEFKSACASYASASQGGAEVVADNARPEIRGQKVPAGVCFVTSSVLALHTTCETFGQQPYQPMPQMTPIAPTSSALEELRDMMKKQAEEARQREEKKDAEMAELRQMMQVMMQQNKK